MSPTLEVQPMLLPTDDPEGCAQRPKAEGPTRKCRVPIVIGAAVGLFLGLAMLVPRPGSASPRPSGPLATMEAVEAVEAVEGVEHVEDAEEVDEKRRRMNCSMYPYLRLLEVVSSNLGGQGPDTDAPWGLVYRGRVEGGEKDGEAFELHLNVTSDAGAFQPQSAREIGFQGKYGSINIKSNSSVTIEMRKYDPKTRQHVPFELFYFTFFDLDQGPNCTASESVTVRPSSKAFIARNSEVRAERLEDGGLRFEATKEGSGDDNPKDPLALTKEQFRKAVTVVAENTDKLEVTLAVGDAPDANPRWFNFRGQPTLLCARRKDGESVMLQEFGGHSGSIGLRAAARTSLIAATLLGVAQQALLA